MYALAKLGFALLLASGPATAQDASRGQEIYMRHCATCHGVDGQGDGPMSPVLIPQPTNLTQLSRRNGGKFPTIRAVMRIDGRDPLVSHGSPMPVYREFFEGHSVAIPALDGMPVLTSQPVIDLIAWLESIQE